MDLNTIMQSDMLYYILIGVVAVLLILVIVIIVAIKKSRKHRAEYEEYPEEDTANESESDLDEEFNQQSEEESGEDADEGDDEPFEDEEAPENEETSEEPVDEDPEVAERHENNYIIEKSAQAHAKRHEKRDWQIESDEDKMNRGAYAEGVDFRYVPNKERYDRYKDMEDEENNAELGRKTFSVEQPEEFDEESAYQEELEFRENVKEEIQGIKNEVSVISESIQKMTEAFFNKNQELMDKMDSLANLQKESQYKLEAQSKESIDRYANVIGSTMNKSIDEGIDKIKKTNEEQHKALADTLEKMSKETKDLLFSVKNRQGENMGKVLASFGKLEASLAILTTSQDVLCQHKDVEDIIPKLNEMSEKIDSRNTTSVKHIEDDQMAVLKALRASVDRLNTKLSNLEVPVIHKETEQNKAKTSNNGQNFEVKKESVEAPAVKPELEHKDSEKPQETKVEEPKPVEQVKKEDAKPEEHKKHPESKAQSQLQPKSQNQPKQQTKPQAKKLAVKATPKPVNKPVKNTNVKSKAPVDKPKANQEQKESPKPHVRTKKVPYTSEQFRQKQLEEEKKREAQIDEEIRNSKLLVKTMEATAKPLKESEVNEYKTKFQRHMEEKQRLEKEKAKQQINPEPVKPQPVVADSVEPKPVVTRPEPEPVSVVEELTLKEAEVVEEVSSMGEIPFEAEQIQEFKPETLEEPEIVTEEPVREEIIEPEESSEVHSEESVQNQSFTEDVQDVGAGVRPYERQTSHAQPTRFTNSGGFISSGDNYSHPGDVGAYKRARASSRPARVANVRAQRASRPSRRTY